MLNPNKIILFGSYAYRTPTPNSDVDLLVVLNQLASHNERYLAVSGLLRPRPSPVDLFVRTSTEIEQARWSNGFVNEVLTKGQVLYER